METKQYRAIDLYSGIGGWSLGLKMAGVEVVASYEWWDKANRTNQENNRHTAIDTDIRQLPMESLPENLDIVVGSPPCTQFSFANRGGNGNIEEGLKDVERFLAVVDHVRPKFWAMENVPRLVKIVVAELEAGGRLHRFAHLKPSIHVIDMCEWGLPQRRQRCIMGNFDFDLLRSYRDHTTKRTLGDVVQALERFLPCNTMKNRVQDPIYGIDIAMDELKDHVIEEYLSKEEERKNREAKNLHPTYNIMAFPDSLDRASRTIMATNTRVSRESIIIEVPRQAGYFRRLSLREQACLQGFPITYQFFGNSHAQKLKMIGNAVPPLLTFYIAQAMLGIKPEDLKSPQEGIKAFSAPVNNPPETRPDIVGHAYVATRKFQSVIPGLHFKSGMRFELSNSFRDQDSQPEWRVKFFLGNHKVQSVSGDFKMAQELPLNSGTLKMLEAYEKLRMSLVKSLMSPIEQFISYTNAIKLQGTWTHSAQRAVGLHPYDLVDDLGLVVGHVRDYLLSPLRPEAEHILSEILLYYNGPQALAPRKVLEYSESILAGVLVGSLTNELLASKAFNQSGSDG